MRSLKDETVHKLTRKVYGYTVLCRMCRKKCVWDCQTDITPMYRAFAGILQTVKTDRRLTGDWQETDRFGDGWWLMYDGWCKMWIAIHGLLLAICNSVLAVLIGNSLENFQNSVTNLRNSLENLLSLQLIRTSRSLRRMLSVCCQSWQSPEWLQTLCTSWFCQSDSLGSENSTVITKIYRNNEYLYAGSPRRWGRSIGCSPGGNYISQYSFKV